MIRNMHLISFRKENTLEAVHKTLGWMIQYLQQLLYLDQMSKQVFVVVISLCCFNRLFHQPHFSAYFTPIGWILLENYKCPLIKNISLSVHSNLSSNSVPVCLINQHQCRPAVSDFRCFPVVEKLVQHLDASLVCRLKAHSLPGSGCFDSSQTMNYSGKIAYLNWACEIAEHWISINEKLFESRED